jgi:hypothetical protein
MEDLRSTEAADNGHIPQVPMVEFGEPDIAFLEPTTEGLDVVQNESLAFSRTPNVGTSRSRDLFSDPRSTSLGHRIAVGLGIIPERSSR